MFALISNIFGYLLNFLYEILNNNFGYAIILFSILLRIILLPITIKQQRSMQKTSKIQGQLKSLQLKYKNNPEMLNKETMELYKREKISPFSGCLSAIAQIIIILSVFYLVSQPLTYMKKANDTNPELKAVVDEYKKEITEDKDKKTRYIEIATIAKIREEYDGIDEKIKEANNSENIENSNEIENTEKAEEITTEENAENNENKTENQQENNKETLETRKNLLEKLNINMDFLGLDLSKVPSENMNDFRVYIIPVLYVISSFLSIKLNLNTTKKSKNEENKDDDKNDADTMAQMNKSMSYMMPIMTVSIAFIAPLGLALYWLISNVLIIAERFIIKKIMDNEGADENA